MQNPKPERVFDAFWVPRWYGQDQALSVGQETVISFRGPAAAAGSLHILAAGLDQPRHEARCRVLGMKHRQEGRLQAIIIEEDGYRFVLTDGDSVRVGRDGRSTLEASCSRECLTSKCPASEDEVSGVRECLERDWTVRVTLQRL